MTIPRLSMLGIVSAAVLAFLAVAPAWYARPEPITSLGSEDVKEALHHLRSGMEAGNPLALAPSLERFAKDRVPLILSVWVGGKRHRVFQVTDRAFSDALRDLAAGLKSLGPERLDLTLRLALDAGTAVGRVSGISAAAALSFAEGHDGIIGETGGRTVLVPPSELVRRNVYASLELLPGYDLEFKTGVDRRVALLAVRSQARALGIAAGEADIKGRFRAASAVEGADRIPRALIQGTVERAAPDRARVEAGVRAGADYLVNAMDERGKFRYLFDPLDDDVPKDYSWTRHYGAAYSLALVGRILGEPEYLAAAGKAIGAGIGHLKPASIGGRCFFEGDRCYFGVAALFLLATAEHGIASGEPRYGQAEADLAAFVRAMQRPDGLFYHYFRTRGGIDRREEMLFASQQGVLALARHARATGDRAALSAAERGMDHLAGAYWNFFLGKWFFVAEHWSCLAAEEMYAQAPKTAYAEFCRDVGAHFARTILKKDAAAFPENAGGMVVTHALSPHGCGTATAAEAMTSAVALGAAAGLDAAEIREAAISSYGFLLKTQLNAHDTFWTPRPALALGGFFEKQIVPRIRIDYVQHAISALVRGLDLFPEKPPGAAAEAGRDFVVAVPP